MAAPKKRDVEHKFLARVDNTPDDGQPGMWDRIVAYADRESISANDALNEMIEIGLKRKKL